MTRIKGVSQIATVLMLALLIAVPSFAARGAADFTRFVAIGDSYGAGVENNSLNQNHQPYAWPAVIARQTHASFVQPLVSYPGIGPEMVLTDIISYPPKIVNAAGQGQPLNLTYPAPYNDLAVPGASVNDVITLTGAEKNPTTTSGQFAQFILRGLGTEVQQAVAQKPTFVAIWIGGIDALNAAFAGTPAVMTPTDAFSKSYNTMLDQLTTGAPNAGMVVGTIPTNPMALPYVTTVPPVLINPATRTPILGPDGKPIYYVADLGGGTIGQLPPGSVVLLPTAAKIATGYGFPAALAANPAFAGLPNIGKPLADSDVITPTEFAAIVARINEYNTVITQAASSRNIPVADIKGLFDRLASAKGYQAGPFTLTGAYITGGAFSLDGFHMTDMGYTVFADEYIKAINAAYDSNIPLAGLAQFFADNGAFFPKTTSGAPFFEGMEWELSAEAAKSLQMMLVPAAPSRGRLRAVSH